MNLMENLRKQIEQVIQDSGSPIVAGENWASRDNGLSSGLSGLNLALFQADDRSSLAGVKAPIANLFSADLEFRNGDLYINEEAIHAPTRHPPILGDLFTGVCNNIWTSLVLNHPISPERFKLDTGPVIRPGLGHGELIREFVLWYCNHKVNNTEFLLSEMEFEGAGWCNGEAGLLVIETLANLVSNKSFKPISYLSRVDSILSKIEKADISTSEYNLCHGFIGALVVVAGVARTFGNEALVAESGQIFKNKIQPEILLNMSQGNLVDCSWLTGIAGVVWAEKVFKKLPLINPIVPFDSLIFSNY